MVEQRTAQEVLESLSSVGQGLSDEEAAGRLAKDGPNALPEKAPPTTLQRFLSQLKDPMIYVLLAAAVISVLLHEYSDALIILAVILINAVVGTLQEGKAERALDALKKMSSPSAVVRRGGAIKEILAKELVKGDIVLLDAGRVVPADLRLLESASLKVEESALTGESVPVEKSAEFVAQGEVPLGDRINMAYMSTAVTYGRGEGVVTGTGRDTEMGKIATMIEDAENAMTPLQKRLADLSKLLGILAILICVAMFGIAVLQKRDMVEMLLTAISLAVAAVPEGLPAVVTIVLALGVQRLVKVNTIVRRLPAVETLGAVSVVCSDKTGTLTQNKMTVVEIFEDDHLAKAEEADYPTFKTIIEGMALCTDASIVDGQRVGDPTELAFLDLAAKYDVHKPTLEANYPRVNEKAFDSDRKLMTTVHRTGERIIAYTKGATDELLARCSEIIDDGLPRPITEEDKRAIREVARGMATRALRVLSLALRYDDQSASENNLCYMGMMGMIDPPRPEAKEAVDNFKKAGVTTVMITGDHRDTAFAIAKELGIADSELQCLTGEELDKMTGEQLAERAPDIRVYARVSPSNKVQIVNAIQSRGKIVSMTGDGVNDAPSLQAADIGVAMGITGTDVAKGAADIVLTDDNFATIRHAIEEGRGIYANIKKTVLFLLSSNLGEVFSMFTAILLGLLAPLRSVHILWVNLITDSLPALALGSDAKPAGIMEEPPRDANESLFANGGYAITIGYGLLIGALTLGAFLLSPVQALLRAGTPISIASIDSILKTGDMLAHAQTYAFCTLAMSQLFHAIGMRDVNHFAIGPNLFKNKMMLFAFGFGFLLQILATEIPLFTRAFYTSQLTVMEWVMLLAFASIPLWVHELLVLVRGGGKPSGASTASVPSALPAVEAQASSTAAEAPKALPAADQHTIQLPAEAPAKETADKQL